MGSESTRSLEGQVASPPGGHQRLPRWLLGLIWVVVPLAFGWFSVELGRTFSWDVRNYHYYSPFAFLEDRIGHDIVPGARQSFHNPLIDVPFFLAYRHLPGPLAGFLLGGLHGLNFALLFLVAWSAQRLPSRLGRRMGVALAVAFCGLFHSTFLVQVGGAAQDNLVSLFVLGGLVVLLHRSREPAPASLLTTKRIVIAGFLVGAAVGLKPTAAIFAVGLAAAVPFLSQASLPRRVWLLLLLAVGGGLGAAVSGGFWALRMERLTGNPVFPYLNHIFRSPLVRPDSFEYRGFLSTETWLYGNSSVRDAEEWALRRLGGEDFRFQLLLVLAIVLILAWLVRCRPTPDPWIEGRRGLFLAVFFVGSLVAWLKVFAISRYLLAASLLTPLLCLFFLERISLRSWWRGAALAVLATLLLLRFDLSNRERVPWSPNPFEVDLETIPIREDTLVVMVDHSPTSYVIPEFPSGVRFVRPIGNLYLTPKSLLFEQIVTAVKQHRGPIFVLFEGRPKEVWKEHVPVLRRLGLDGVRRSCFSLRERRIHDRLALCVSRRAKRSPRVVPKKVPKARAVEKSQARADLELLR